MKPSHPGLIILSLINAFLVNPLMMKVMMTSSKSQHLISSTLSCKRPNKFQHKQKGRGGRPARSQELTIASLKEY